MSPIRQLHYFNAPTYIMFASIWEKVLLITKLVPVKCHQCSLTPFHIHGNKSLLLASTQQVILKSGRDQKTQNLHFVLSTKHDQLQRIINIY